MQDRQQVIDFIRQLAGTQKVEFNNLTTVVDFNKAYSGTNMYFVAWIPEKTNARCSDADIKMKKYFFVDIDIRNSFYKKTNNVISDEELLQEIEKIKEALQGSDFDDWTALVHSGNWLHIYYVGKDELEIDAETYSYWVQSIYSVLNDAFREIGYQVDAACHNIARISRMPWSINPRKKILGDKVLYDMWPFQCHILEYRPEVTCFSFDFIKEFAGSFKWELASKHIVKSYIKPKTEWQYRDKINAIDICSIATSIWPVTVDDRWKDNTALKESHKNMWAYYYRPYNIIVNTGSSLIKNTDKKTFTVWELVLYEVCWWDKKSAIEWFETQYDIKPDEKVKIHDKIPDRQPYDVLGYVYGAKVFESFDCLMSWELAIIIWGSNVGKAQPLDSLILTPSWRRTMGNINIWDYVTWIDGAPKLVLGIPSYWEQNIYKITMSDWTSCEAGEFHEFRVKWKTLHSHDYKDIEVHNIKNILDNWWNLAVPLISPVNLYEHDLPYDPYTLWVLIGDWCLGSGSIMLSIWDKQILDNISIPDTDEIIYSQKYDYRIRRKQRNNKPSSTMSFLRDVWLCVLSKDKFIPEAYKNASMKDRLALLQWLFDTDWTISKVRSNHNTISHKLSYSTCSNRLRNDIIYLIKSLWWVCNLSQRIGKYRDKNGIMKECQMSYTLTYSLPDSMIHSRLNKKLQYGRARQNGTQKIKNVEYIGRKIAKCISVEDEMYITDNFIPTHNTSMCMNMMQANSAIGRRCFYINLEFDIRQVAQKNWLSFHWKTKRNLTDIDPLSQDEREEMDLYVEDYISKFDYYNNPNGITLDSLVDILLAKRREWYTMFVVDTFSRIAGNLDWQTARTNQNKVMETLQALCQNTGILLLMLHHENKAWKFEWSQKIHDLSNVFIEITREDWVFWVEATTTFKLTKDKRITANEVIARYSQWEYLPA